MRLSLSNKHTGAAAVIVAALLLFGPFNFAWAQRSNANTNQNTEVIFQLQTLLEEVRALRGQVESQQVEIENLQRRQRDQYLDLDQRLQSLGRQALSGEPASAASQEEGLVATPLGESMPGVPVADRPEVRAPINTTPEVITLAPPQTGGQRILEAVSEAEQAQYDQAFSALRSARYADAAQQFSAFIDAYPNSSYAPNAYYWLAETYYVTQDFETARAMFESVLERYPNSSKSGDALLKLGFSYFELEQWPQARSALEQVRADYPDTTLSRLAEGRLRDMRLSGRF